MKVSTRTLTIIPAIAMVCAFLAMPAIDVGFVSFTYLELGSVLLEFTNGAAFMALALFPPLLTLLFSVLDSRNGVIGWSLVTVAFFGIQFMSVSAMLKEFNLASIFSEMIGIYLSDAFTEIIGSGFWTVLAIAVLCAVLGFVSKEGESAKKAAA